MEDLRIFEELVRLKRERRPGVLATVVASEGSTPRKAGTKMLVAEGLTCGTVGGGPVEDEVLREAGEVMADGRPRSRVFALDEQSGAVCGGRLTVFLEPLKVSPHCVVVGCGHVGRAVARTARQAGFLVTLVDPEGKFPSAEAVGEAHDFVACPPERLAENLAADETTYFMIAARDHRLDFLAAREALRTKSPFIGVLGSRRKRQALEVFLGEQGLEAELQRLVSPVGLEIGAETPEEIAVSVVAQLIQRRRDVEDIGDRAGGGTVAADGLSQAAAADR